MAQFAIGQKVRHKDIQGTYTVIAGQPDSSSYWVTSDQHGTRYCFLAISLEAVGPAPLPTKGAVLNYPRVMGATPVDRLAAEQARGWRNMRPAVAPNECPKCWAPLPCKYHT